MNELNKIRGYTIKGVSNGSSDNKPQMEMKYFILGLSNQIYFTSNLALIQYLINNSSSIGMLYKKCDKYLKRFDFVGNINVSDIKVHNQPEKFPFYNNKYFELTLVPSIQHKNLENSQSMNQDKIFFYAFSFDDDFIMSLHQFMKSYRDTIANQKKRKEFLSQQISIKFSNEEQIQMETLNYKKHLENYKQKMKLIIKKMEIDQKELEEGIEIQSAIVVDDEEEEEDKNDDNQYENKNESNTDQNQQTSSNKLVKLSNGSLYAGEIKNKMPEGYGKEFLEDGSSYVGNFKQGLWHGLGYLVDSENSICYGEFIKGRIVGI